MRSLRRWAILGRKVFRLYRVEIFLTLTLLAGAIANADDLRVVEVRRNIPLADTDPVYKDFYIAGTGAGGLKPNLVVRALRKTSMKDATGTHSLGEMMVPVGQLKVIFAQQNLAVAREYKLFPRSDLPMLEQSGIMSGDQIDVKDSFVDKKTAAIVKKPKTVAKPAPAKKVDVGVTLITATVPAPASAPPGVVLNKTATAELAKDVPQALPEKKEGKTD